MATREAYIRFTGFTLYNYMFTESMLPGGEITDDLLYHMFASGLFEVIVVKREFEDQETKYDRPRMQRWVQEKDRLEIRRLRAELESAKEAARLQAQGKA